MEHDLDGLRRQVTSRWIPQWTQTYQYDWAVLSPVEYSPAVVWNPFAQNPYSSGVLSVGYPGGGLTTSLDVLPGVRQNILVPIQSNYGGPFRITATQGVGLDSFELAYQIVQGEGTYMLDFTPTAGNVRLNIIRVMSNNDGSMGYLTLLAPRRYILGYTPQNQLVQVCPTPKDQYRFGYNGQHKTNEWAGVGNNIDYLYRGLDTRIGRFYTVDPVTKDYAELTPYQVASNNPIGNFELEGLEGVPYASDPRWYMMEGFRQYMNAGANFFSFEWVTSWFKDSDHSPAATSGGTTARQYTRTANTTTAAYRGWDIFKPGAWVRNSDGTYSKPPAPKVPLSNETTVVKQTSASVSTPVSSTRSVTTTRPDGSSSTTRSVEVGRKANNGMPVKAEVSNTKNSDGTSSTSGKVSVGPDAANVFVEVTQTATETSTSVGVSTSAKTPTVGGTTYGVESTLRATVQQPRR